LLLLLLLLLLTAAATVSPAASASDLHLCVCCPVHSSACETTGCRRMNR
jgi:hypothetical protein